MIVCHKVCKWTFNQKDPYKTSGLFFPLTENSLKYSVWWIKLQSITQVKEPNRLLKEEFQLCANKADLLLGWLATNKAWRDSYSRAALAENCWISESICCFWMQAPTIRNHHCQAYRILLELLLAEKKNQETKHIFLLNNFSIFSRMGTKLF